MSGANYDYILDLASRLSPVSRPKMLDFGCGRGQVVALGVQKGLDICGADTFDGIYENWEGESSVLSADNIHRIEQGRLPFSDATFDIVLSNYVFEHIKDYHQSLEEIARVLKPEGLFIALFPVHETWYEGHVKMYFPHYLARWPRLQRAYMQVSCQLGLSSSRKHRTPAEWAANRQEVLRTSCFYHPRRKIMQDITAALGTPPKLHQEDHIIWRLKNHKRLAGLSSFFSKPVFQPLLAFICLKRAGIVLSVRKAL